MNDTSQHPDTPPQPPIEPPVHPPVAPHPQADQGVQYPVPGTPPQQPGAPVTPPPHNQETDVMGIIGIILSFIGFAPIGLILGLIGASKAKREQRSPVLSRIAWIIGLVITVLYVIGFILLITFGALAAMHGQQAINEARDSYNASTAAPTPRSGERREAIDGFSLLVPSTFVDAPSEYKSASSSFMQGDSATDEYVSIIKESHNSAGIANYTLQQYADDVNDANYRNYDGLTSVTVTPYSGMENSANYNTLDYEVHGLLDGTGIVYYVRYIETNDYFYQVVTWTSEDRVLTSKPTLTRIIDSFREDQ